MNASADTAPQASAPSDSASVQGEELAPSGVLRQHVASAVARRQAGYLKKTPGAVSELAKLRRAATTTAGADPEVWFATLGELPDQLVGHGDDPSAYESAIHGAITLHAIHQQSKGTGMHQPSQGLGKAVRRLIHKNGSTDAPQDSPLMRRFRALGTSTSPAETQHHLRGLIGQLRAADIGLDYGLLAQDLYRLQIPALADTVRLRWGRDLHRAPTDQPATQDITAHDVPDGDMTTSIETTGESA